MSDYYGTKIETTHYRGSEVRIETRMCESVRVSDDKQLLAEFLRFLDELKHHPERFDPEFKMHHAKVNTMIEPMIVRITKCWSELN